MKFILAAGANHLVLFARSQSAYPNRATASFLAARNFLTERSHHLSWHAGDLDISGNQTLALRSTPVQLWDAGVFFLIHFFFPPLEFHHEVQSEIWRFSPWKFGQVVPIKISFVQKQHLVKVSWKLVFALLRWLKKQLKTKALSEINQTYLVPLLALKSHRSCLLCIWSHLCMSDTEARTTVFTTL